MSMLIASTRVAMAVLLLGCEWAGATAEASGTISSSEAPLPRLPLREAGLAHGPSFTLADAVRNRTKSQATVAASNTVGAAVAAHAGGASDARCVHAVGGGGSARAAGVVPSADAGLEQSPIGPRASSQAPKAARTHPAPHQPPPCPDPAALPLAPSPSRRPCPMPSGAPQRPAGWRAGQPRGGAHPPLLRGRDAAGAALHEEF